jgi:putative peptidoglycan lipid II flippase
MAQSQGRMAASVGAGILLTRLLGFARERIFAHYFGAGPALDAFRAALKIPNIIRNLLGEGTLSASFIPVYASMLAKGDHEGAKRLSSVVVSLLVLLAALGALVGFWLAPIITDFAAPGFTGATRDLTVVLVKIMFPTFGVIIISAWCLGILNTHRWFFLSYAAPAVWNIAQIGTLIALGSLLVQHSLAVAVAWGALGGSVLQIAVQLPAVVRVSGWPRWTVNLNTPGVRKVIRAWIPVVFGAGVYQISSLIDTQLGSLLETGSVAILGYAQLVAILPVSLFGGSVAAVALPDLSRDVAAADVAVLRARLADGARRIAYFAIPSAASFAALSTVLLAALFQTGEFGPTQTIIAGSVLAAYAIAVPAQASVKLFAYGHYAFGDTRTPMIIAAISVVASAGSAYALMQHFGPAGIALGAAVGGWLNLVLNFVTLSRRVGRILDAAHRHAILAGAGAALPAALAAAAVAGALARWPVWISAVAALLTMGLGYGVLTLLFSHPDAQRLVRRSRTPRRGQFP